MAIYFNGKRLVKPQAVSMIDTSKLVGLSVGGGYNICLLGSCAGGEPTKMLTFIDPSEAKSTLVSGDVYAAALMAFSPSPNQNGASVVNTVRVNPATQSTFTPLVDSGSNSLFTAYSVGYGTATKRIQYKIDVATNKYFTYTPVANKKIIRVVSITSNATAVAGTASLVIVGTATFTMAWAGGVAVAVSGDGSYTLVGAATYGTIVVAVTGTILTETIAVAFKAAGVKVSIKDIGSSAQVETQDNIGVAFTVRYTGTVATACALTTTASSIATTVTGATADNLSIDLTDSQFNTIGEVVAFINAQTNYVAYLSSGYINSNLASISIYPASAVEILNCTHTATAAIAAVLDWVNNNSALMTLTDIHATTTGIVATTLGYWVSLAGGVEGTMNSTAWTNALAVLETEDIDIIVALTTDPTVQSLVNSHVLDMNTRKKERRAYYGVPLDSTVAAINTICTTFNNRWSVVATDSVLLDVNGKGIVEYDSSFMAAIYAGMKAGFASMAEPLTYKYLNVLSLGTSFDDLDVISLLEAGAAPAEFVKGSGIRIVQGRTTYIMDDKVVNVEDSVSCIADYIAKDSRKTLEDAYVGSRANSTTIQGVKTTLVSRLQDYEKTGLITGGLDPQTLLPILAYRNISVVFSNRVCSVKFEVSPVEPLNWITITASFTPATIIA